MAESDQAERHSLLPIKLAAYLVWQRVYEGRLPAEREATLNSIALTLAVFGEIYEFDTAGDRPARRLSKHELNAGMFRGGAEELHFLDGRPPRRFLAVPSHAVLETIEALKQAGST